MEAPIQIIQYPPDVTQETTENLKNFEIKIEDESKEKYNQKYYSRPEESNLEDSENNYNVIIIQQPPEVAPWKRNSLKDFQIIQILGRGSYARVVLATNIYTNKQYALKIIDKEFLAKVNKT
jgi:hypothetical protein